MSSFAEDVLKGLSSKPKYLSSKYFYDKTGDKIFQDIMNMKEYYPTDCEFEILSQNKDDLKNLFISEAGSFNLVELGAGDGFKTKILLKHFIAESTEFTFIPIDISSNAIHSLVGDLQEEIPELKVDGWANEYFEALKTLNKYDNKKKIILFLGSSIGNFKVEEAIIFLSRLAENMNPDDLLMIGFDLKKDPHVILEAYNDKGGITKAFNLNLLRRINNELDGHFDLTQFEHFPTYDPSSGECKSYLISNKKQQIDIERLEGSFEFNLWEPIYMEVSQKYDLEMIEKIAENSKLEIVKHFFDCKHYFVDTVMKLNH